MSSVFQSINLPVGGSTMVLGPCTFSAKWPAKASKNNKLYRNVEASDGTGSIKITLWGDAANLPIHHGMLTSIKGSLKRGDYNGTPQLSGEQGLSLDGSIAGQASLPSASAQGQPAMQQAQSSGGYSRPAEEKITHVQLANQMAEFTVELEQALLNKGIQKEVVNKIVERAPEYAALWWFGAKELRMAVLASSQEQPSDGDEIPY